MSGYLSGWVGGYGLTSAAEMDCTDYSTRDHFFCHHLGFIFLEKRGFLISENRHLKNWSARTLWLDQVNNYWNPILQFQLVLRNFKIDILAICFQSAETVLKEVGKGSFIF